MSEPLGEHRCEKAPREFHDRGGKITRMSSDNAWWLCLAGDMGVTVPMVPISMCPFCGLRLVPEPQNALAIKVGDWVTHRQNGLRAIVEATDLHFAPILRGRIGVRYLIPTHENGILRHLPVTRIDEFSIDDFVAHFDLGTSESRKQP